MSGGLFYNPFLRPNKGLLKKPDKEYLRWNDGAFLVRVHRLKYVVDMEV